MDRLKPAIFLDRDGVINKRIVDGYVLKWEDFKFMPDAIPALKLLYSTRLPLFVVSNQLCVNAEMIKYYQAGNIMEQMREQLEKSHIRIRAAMICPHTADEHCSCRKPEPGMIYTLARHNNICLEDSYIIGDSWSDIDAGYRAHISHTIKVGDMFDYGNYEDFMENVTVVGTFLLAAQWVVEDYDKRYCHNKRGE